MSDYTIEVTFNDVVVGGSSQGGWSPYETLPLIGWSYAVDLNGVLEPEPTGNTTGDSYFDLYDITGTGWRFTPDLNGALQPTLSGSTGSGSTYKIFKDTNGNQWLIGVDTNGNFTQQNIGI